MLIREHIDHISSAEILLNEVFQHIFQNDVARTNLGFSQISQVASDEGFPGWYLWFSDMKGAWHIEITCENPISSGKVFKDLLQPETVKAVGLVLRYFPDIEEKVFETFSCFEQIFRMGPNFDATGTTTFEGARAMPESFYVVGHMIIMFDNRNGDIDFFCRAPKRWRDYRTHGLALANSQGGKIQLLAPGERDRDVEGWNLTRQIFDKIVSAYSFLIRRPPAVVGASAGSSMEYLIDKSNKIKEIVNEQTKEFLLLVSFRQDINLNDAEAMLTSEAKNLIGLWSDPGSIPEEWDNPLWWSISDHHFHDGNCFLCSCYHDQH
jgi:hypothetical protein